MKHVKAFITIFIWFILFGSYINPQEVKASSSPEQVLESFNSASTYEEAMKYLVGRVKEQMEAVFVSLNKGERDKGLKKLQRKYFRAVTLPGIDSRHAYIVTVVETKGGTLIYEMVNINNEWKIEWRNSGNALTELFTQKFYPVQFHSQNIFRFNSKPFKMESVFATYEKSESTEDSIWINLKFYPFKFQERDIEFLKFGTGILVEETGSPTTLASSLKYPVIRLDIMVNKNNQLAAFSFGYESISEDKQVSTAVNPPLNMLGIRKFRISNNSLTLIMEGNSLGDINNSWNVHVDNLPLLKYGL